MRSKVNKNEAFIYQNKSLLLIENEAIIYKIEELKENKHES